MHTDCACSSALLPALSQANQRKPRPTTFISNHQLIPVRLRSRMRRNHHVRVSIGKANLLHTRMVAHHVRLAFYEIHMKDTELFEAVS